MAWKLGKVLVWDTTCPDTYAPSHAPEESREAGAVALKAEQLKLTKCTLLEPSHLFVPFVLEKSGVLGHAGLDLSSELGQCLFQTTGEPHSREYLLQRLSIAMQRGNTEQCWPPQRLTPTKVIPSGINCLIYLIYLCMTYCINSII